MPNLKLQVSRALSVIPSDDTNIPMPSVIVSSTATATTANKLVDSTKNFSSVGANPLNVQVGDTIYDISNSSAAMVTNVDSATQLTLNVNIIGGLDFYTLYSGTNITGTVEPCVLYVGIGGDMDIVTAGGDNLQVNGASPFVLDNDKATETARASAVKNAKAKATSYAKLLGVKLGKVIYLDETSTPTPYPVFGVSAKAEDSATQIDLGEQKVTVSVTVRWSIG